RRRRLRRRSLARRDHVFGWRTQSLCGAGRGRIDRYAPIASSGRRSLQLVGLPNAFLSKEPRFADRCDPREQIVRAALHRGGNRARDAKGKGTIRSRASLGGVFALSQIKEPLLEADWTGNTGRRNLPLMSRVAHQTVSAVPSTPLVIFDGNCHFCRL